MTKIQNIDPGVGTLSHEGEVYVGKDGLFDVPAEVATALANFPHWRLYDGNPWPHPKTEEQAEEERTEAIAKKVVAEMSKPEPKRRQK